MEHCAAINSADGEANYLAFLSPCSKPRVPFAVIFRLLHAKLRPPPSNLSSSLVHRCYTLPVILQMIFLLAFVIYSEQSHHRKGAATHRFLLAPVLDPITRLLPPVPLLSCFRLIFPGLEAY